MRLDKILGLLVSATFLLNFCLAQPKEVFENPYPLKTIDHQCLHSTITDSRTIYSYDSQHRLLRMEKVSNRQVWAFTDYFYNQKGLVERQVQQKVQDKIAHIEVSITYSYDQKGNLRQMLTNHLINGASSATKETFEYRDHQLIKRSRFQYKFGKWFMDLYSEYAYSGELLTNVSVYDGKDRFSYSTTFTYQNSKLMQTQTMGKNGTTHIEPYEYNENGYLVRKLRNESQYEEYAWQNGKLVSKKQVDLSNVDPGFSPFCARNTIELYSYYQ